jgi:hypothetical protein
MLGQVSSGCDILVLDMPGKVNLVQGRSGLVRTG